MKKMPPSKPSKKEKDLIRQAADDDMDMAQKKAMKSQFPNMPTKKKVKPKGYKSGGKVRGAGCAMKGARKAKMY